MKATLLSIGDELLIGQVVNTNAAWLGEHLGLLGIEVVRAVTLGDEEAPIREELAAAYEASDLVLLTGGLGPTHDDITRDVVADFFGVVQHVDAAVLEKIRARFRRRQRPMPPSSERMALVPEGFAVLPNSVGTAPGLLHVDAEGDAERLVVLLPGVPREMQAIFQEALVPRLRAQKGIRAVRHRTLLTVGVGESNLQELLGDLSSYLGPTLRLAYLPGTGGVRLRITATGTDRIAVALQLDRLETYLRAHIEPYLYGRDEDTLEAVLGRMLSERGQTIAVAESCTGGQVLDRLTNIPGSSAYVVGGVVAYANAVKVNGLGVEHEALTRYGAVSEVVARQMAQGVRDRLGADVGVSTTGVAGPTGGTPDKPVGTVWIGYADAYGAVAERRHFLNDRALNKALAATAALDLARRNVLSGPQESTR